MYQKKREFKLYGVVHIHMLSSFLNQDESWKHDFLFWGRWVRISYPINSQFMYMSSYISLINGNLIRTQNTNKTKLHL